MCLNRLGSFWILQFHTSFDVLRMSKNIKWLQSSLNPAITWLSLARKAYNFAWFQSVDKFFCRKEFIHTFFVAKIIYAHSFVVKTIYAHLFCRKNNLHTHFRCTSFSWIHVGEWLTQLLMFLRFCQILGISSGYIKGISRVYQGYTKGKSRVN